MKRFLALFLVLTLCVSALAACSKDNKTTDTSANDNKSDTQQQGGNTGDTGNEEGGDQAADEWTWPLPEKKDLSMWLTWSCDYATDPNELHAIKEIENRTNVHVKWSTVNSAEASEKFGLMIGSGDYPDIIRQLEGYYVGGLVQACNDGVIIDMTDYIKQYMPTYMGLRLSNEKLLKDTVTDDGRMVGAYTLASNDGEIDGERVWGGLCLRQDWLNDLGLDVPVTIDDWHTVLKAFKDNYNCEAPLLIGATNGYDAFGDFISAYGVLGEFYKEGNTVKYGPMEDGYRQWVQTFHDWYAEGLIDPNFITNDAAFLGSAEYTGTGRAGASASIWGMTADVYKVQGYTDDEDFFLVGAPAPVLNAGDTPQVGMAMSELTKETLAITTNCKDIELACRWLDYWYTDECMWLDAYGIEGDNYRVEADGTVYLTDKVYDMVASGDYPTPQQVMSTYTLMTSDFGLYSWNMFEPVNRGQRALEACDIWDVASYDLMLPPCMTMTEDESVAYNSKYVSIQTLVQENTIKFITGAQSMDQYDSFVQTMKDYGIEECIGYQQAAFDRYNAR